MATDETVSRSDESGREWVETRPAVLAAQLEVVDARRALVGEMDDLGVAARAALDIPDKVRRHPLRVAGLAGGAAFLGVGGPRRVLKAVERRVAPSRADRVKSVLPDEIVRIVDRLGGDAEKARKQLERDFASYVEKQHAVVVPGARSSFWRTYDAFVGVLGAIAARELAKRIFETPRDRARAPAIAVAATPPEQPSQPPSGRSGE
jgi:hypothetical protein